MTASEDIEAEGDQPVSEPTMGQIFIHLQVWLAGNTNCRVEDQQVLLQDFHLSGFTGKELLTIVKDSQMFPEEEIIKECIKRFEECSNCEVCHKSQASMEISTRDPEIQFGAS